MAGINLDLAAQLINENPQIFGLIRELPSPNRLKQSSMGHDLASIVDQVFENVKLLGSQRISLPPTTTRRSSMSMVTSPTCRRGVGVDNF